MDEKQLWPEIKAEKLQFEKFHAAHQSRLSKLKKELKNAKAAHNRKQPDFV